MVKTLLKELVFKKTTKTELSTVCNWETTGYITL